MCDARQTLTENARIANETMFRYTSARNEQVWSGAPFTDFVDERTTCTQKPKSNNNHIATVTTVRCGPFWTLTKNNEQSACSK